MKNFGRKYFAYVVAPTNGKNQLYFVLQPSLTTRLFGRINSDNPVPDRDMLDIDIRDIRNNGGRVVYGRLPLMSLLFPVRYVETEEGKVQARRIALIPWLKKQRKKRKA